MIPSDLSFGYLSAELKSPVKIPILTFSAVQGEQNMRAINGFMTGMLVFVLTDTHAHATEFNGAGPDSLSSGFPTEQQESESRGQYKIVQDANDPGSF